MILVVTSKNDLTADRLVCELTDRNASFARFDLAEFPRALSMSAVLEGADSHWNGEIRTTCKRVQLSDVQAIYYRRPTGFELPDHLGASDRAFAVAEARRGVGGLLHSMSCTWVNHPARVADAEFKPAQLAVAADCGFRVPRSLLTNDPDSAREFVARHGASALYKPMSAANIVDDGGGVSMVFTSRVRPDDIVDADTALTMNLFQEWVPKLFDARVTVFGDRVFGVAIDAGSPAGHLDWRIDYSSLTYRPVEVPGEVCDAMLGYLSRWGLTYGAFDFAVTEEAWFFLKCNANGQFGWIEAEVGLPMTEALADLLIGGS